MTQLSSTRESVEALGQIKQDASAFRASMIDHQFQRHRQELRPVVNARYLDFATESVTDPVTLDYEEGPTESTRGIIAAYAENEAWLNRLVGRITRNVRSGFRAGRGGVVFGGPGQSFGDDVGVDIAVTRLGGVEEVQRMFPSFDADAYVRGEYDYILNDSHLLSEMLLNQRRLRNAEAIEQANIGQHLVGGILVSIADPITYLFQPINRVGQVTFSRTFKSAVDAGRGTRAAIREGIEAARPLLTPGGGVSSKSTFALHSIAAGMTSQFIQEEILQAQGIERGQETVLANVLLGGLINTGLAYGARASGISTRFDRATVLRMINDARRNTDLTPRIKADIEAGTMRDADGEVFGPFPAAFDEPIGPLTRTAHHDAVDDVFDFDVIGQTRPVREPAEGDRILPVSTVRPEEATVVVSAFGRPGQSIDMVFGALRDRGVEVRGERVVLDGKDLTLKMIRNLFGLSPRSKAISQRKLNLLKKLLVDHTTGARPTVAREAAPAPTITPAQQTARSAEFLDRMDSDQITAGKTDRQALTERVARDHKGVDADRVVRDAEARAQAIVDRAETEIRVELTKDVAPPVAPRVEEGETRLVPESAEEIPTVQTSRRLGKRLREIEVAARDSIADAGVDIVPESRLGPVDEAVARWGHKLGIRVLPYEVTVAGKRVDAGPTGGFAILKEGDTILYRAGSDRAALSGVLVHEWLHILKQTQPEVWEGIKLIARKDLDRFHKAYAQRADDNNLHDLARKIRDGDPIGDEEAVSLMGELMLNPRGAGRRTGVAGRWDKFLALGTRAKIAPELMTFFERTLARLARIAVRIGGSDVRKVIEGLVSAQGEGRSLVDAKFVGMVQRVEDSLLETPEGFALGDPYTPRATEVELTRAQNVASTIAAPTTRFGFNDKFMFSKFWLTRELYRRMADSALRLRGTADGSLDPVVPTTKAKSLNMSRAATFQGSATRAFSAMLVALNKTSGLRARAMHTLPILERSGLQAELDYKGFQDLIGSVRGLNDTDALSPKGMDVYNRVGPEGQERLDSIAREIGAKKFEDVAPFVDEAMRPWNVADAPRVQGRELARLETMNQTSVLRLRDGSTLHDVVAAEHVIRGNADPAPRLDSPEANRLLSPYARSGALPADWAARPGEWDAFARIATTQWNTNWFGTVPRAAVSQLLEMRNSADTLMFRSHYADSLWQWNRAENLMATYQSLRDMAKLARDIDPDFPVPPPVSFPGLVKSVPQRDVLAELKKRTITALDDLTDRANILLGAEEPGPPATKMKKDFDALMKEFKRRSDLEPFSGSEAGKNISRALSNLTRGAFLGFSALPQIHDVVLNIGKSVRNMIAHEAVTHTTPMAKQFQRTFKLANFRLKREMARNPEVATSWMRDMEWMMHGMTSYMARAYGELDSPMFTGGLSATERVGGLMANLLPTHPASFTSRVAETANNLAGIYGGMHLLTDINYGTIYRREWREFMNRLPTYTQAIDAARKSGRDVSEELMDLGLPVHTIDDFMRYMRPEDFATLRPLLEDQDNWVNVSHHGAKDPLMEFTGASKVASDPLVQRQLRAEAVERAGGAAAPPRTEEMGGLLDRLHKEEGAVQRLAHALNFKVLQGTIPTPDVGARMQDAANPLKSLMLTFLSVPQAISTNLVTRGIQNGTAEFVTLAAFLIGGSAAVNYLRAFLSGRDMDLYIQRMEEDPQIWMAEVLGWSGLIGITGEKTLGWLAQAASDNSYRQIHAGTFELMPAPMAYIDSWRQAMTGLVRELATDKPITKQQIQAAFRVATIPNLAVFRLLSKGMKMAGIQTPRDAVIERSANISEQRRLERIQVEKQERALSGVIDAAAEE